MIVLHATVSLSTSAILQYRLTGSKEPQPFTVPSRYSAGRLQVISWDCTGKSAWSHSCTNDTLRYELPTHTHTHTLTYAHTHTHAHTHTRTHTHTSTAVQTVHCDMNCRHTRAHTHTHTHTSTVVQTIHCDMNCRHTHTHLQLYKRYTPDNVRIKMMTMHILQYSYSLLTGCRKCLLLY